jgi:hypothetical protein
VGASERASGKGREKKIKLTSLPEAEAGGERAKKAKGKIGTLGVAHHQTGWDGNPCGFRESSYAKVQPSRVHGSILILWFYYTKITLYVWSSETTTKFGAIAWGLMITIWLMIL